MSGWSGWVPVGVDRTGPEPALLWFRLGEYRFDDAFFWETMERCARHPFNLVFGRRTPLGTLEEAAASVSPARPSGIIFHLSRCGSTLVSRTLAAVPGTLAISEAPAVDAVVRARRRDASVTQERQVRWLRALISLFAAAAVEERGYILKLDAWHALDIELFEHAFPRVPWIYVYRDAVEVLVSHANRPSYMMSLANAPDFLGLPVQDAARLAREEYCARVLGRLARAVVERDPQADALVRYDALPNAICDRVAPRFGMNLSERERGAMLLRARYDAKRPGILFQEDGALKRQAAGDALRSAASRWISPHIERLDELAECR